MRSLLIFLRSSRALVAFIMCIHLCRANKSVLLKVIYPSMVENGSSLFVRGSGCGLNWNSGRYLYPSEKSTLWTIELDCDDTIPILEVKVLVHDRIWMLGANHRIEFVTNNTGVLTTSTMYPWFYSRHGSLQILDNVYSPELQNSRSVIYYLPPSYNENTLKPYSNLLVMHDGQNLFDPKTSAFGTAWMCQDTLDETIISGTSDEVVIIGAYNTAARIDEYTYIYDPSEGAGGKGDLYLDWIESTLIPLTVKSFPRFSVEHDHLGILGSSLGGLISCYAGVTRPDVYGRVGCMSSSLWWADQDFQTSLLPSPAAVVNGSAEHAPAIYLDSGTSGSLGGEAQCAVYSRQVFDYLHSEKGFSVTSEKKNDDDGDGDGDDDGVNLFFMVDQGGKHNEASWGKRFHQPIEALYPAANTV